MLSSSGLVAFAVAAVLIALTFPTLTDAARGRGAQLLDTLPPAHNVVTSWGQTYMAMIRLAFPNFSPVAVARATAMITTAMYDAWTAFDDTALPVYEANEFRYSGGTAADIDQALSHAAYCTIENLFSRLPSLVANANLKMQQLGYDPSLSTTSRSTPVGVGNAACQTVVAARANDGFNQNGDHYGSLNPGVAYADWTNYYPINEDQVTPGITDCDAQIRTLNKWQPMLVELGLLPGWSDGAVQRWLGPHIGSAQPYALTSSSQFRARGPPLLGSNSPTNDQVYAQAQEVLDWSGRLNDTLKVIAEFWADGPDSTLPPGHWHTLAIDSAIFRNMSLERSLKLMFLQANAAMDGGIACWETKRFFDSCRPLQLIQCLFRNQQVTAWQGPWRGIGTINASLWQPYQDHFFITPPFAGYVSGHSTFSSASARVMSLFLGSDEYLGPRYVVREGESLFEPKIDLPLADEFVDNLTNIPNTGPNTRGYVPAQDVVLDWATWTDLANQAGISRLYGGIHIQADNVDGLAMGYQVGDVVYAKSALLFAGMRRNDSLAVPSPSACPTSSSARPLVSLLLTALSVVVVVAAATFGMVLSD